MKRRVAKSFFDIIILLELRKHSLGGYDVIHLVHHKFDILLSAGNVYSFLYTLERKGLVKTEYASRRRIFVLTEQGKETVVTILKEKERIIRMILDLFGG
jgi:DNA-binding PadR family transcriptional regulator